ncbi:hypothetical protein F8388_008012 [Cannabis sativa]|uniref:Uncharacterized protein n=1 Tax=Cannabis sativa TaxID=3483 RepID=A0A7J6H8Y4_CANSA|nr:hypothetical protein F8388_008012 [Cannabis sativa]
MQKRPNNVKDFATRRQYGIGNSKPLFSTRQGVSKATMAVDQRRRSGPFPTWQKRAFSASAHEVPSGPNPISNSLIMS